MKKRYKYPLIFSISAFLLLVALTIDNLIWIGKSPEWASVFTVSNNIGSWTGAIQDANIFYQAWYIVGYRIYTVWFNWRDILASVLVGFFIVGVWAFASKLFDKTFRIRF